MAGDFASDEYVSNSCCSLPMRTSLSASGSDTLLESLRVRGLGNLLPGEGGIYCLRELPFGEVKTAIFLTLFSAFLRIALIEVPLDMSCMSFKSFEARSSLD